DLLEGVAGTDVADISDLTETIAPLDRKIFKQYTMVQERNIHRGIIPASEDSPPALAEIANPENDEDLFADALF
ncbi:MAG: chemotaxis protein, partial [Rhizobium sp.]